LVVWPRPLVTCDISVTPGSTPQRVLRDTGPDSRRKFTSPQSAIVHILIGATCRRLRRLPSRILRAAKTPPCRNTRPFWTRERTAAAPDLVSRASAFATARILATPDAVFRASALATSRILATPAPVSRILAFSIAVFLVTPRSRFSLSRAFDRTLFRRAFSYSHAKSRPFLARQHKLFIRRVAVAMAPLVRERSARDD
jgi:hypothetical protein